MKEQITPRPSDWLLVAVVLTLALAALDMLDEWTRLEQSTQAMQGQTSQIRIAQEARP